jgi:hypothetical protein
MFKLPQIPQVKVEQFPVVFAGGVDLISPPGYAAPGTLRFSSNYELDFGGGVSRLLGFERIDGRPSPSRAEYTIVEAAEGFSGLTAGALVEGSISGAQGVIIYVSPDQTRIALSKLTAGVLFEDGDEVLLASSPQGTITNASPSIDSFLDNDLAYLAAELYRADIQQPPGDGPIRGVWVIDNKLFCSRDIGAANRIYQASAAGWVQVDLGFRIPFELGTAPYSDGQALTQGGVTASIRRVVVTAGSFSGGDAEGYFVIDEPTGGNFIAGLAVGSGGCTLMGPQVAISRLAGGRVQTVTHNFFSTVSTRRVYGCDKVNIEFEFDGDVYVPIETGMGSVRASHVFVHKQHLFYSFDSSLQFAGVGEPYKWAPLFGAGELTTGDPITNLINVSGSEANAALIVTCRDSVWALYGASAADWNFIRISEEAGGQEYSGVNMLGPICFDREGFNRYSPSDAFGNFSYESASRAIDPLIRNSSVTASVLVKNRSKYRCFFSDGLFVTATPTGNGLGWMPCTYGRTINVCVGAEVNGQYRIFMGDNDGWVLEADVGRSFDGGVVQASMRTSSMNMRSDVVEKQFRHLFLKGEGSSAYQLAVGAEFSDTDADVVGDSISPPTDFRRQVGSGLFWDFKAWDQAYWDGASSNRIKYSLDGKGLALSLLFASESDRELPHTLKTMTILYTPRRLGR